ncbi:MAG: ATP-binding protein [Saprospiraceae bacterium]|nr:ATP-binding protein [Saprospiraceae bacterium]
MIVEFSVTNFGSIRDTQTLSMIADRDDTLSEYYVVEAAGLRLLKLAILYGPNASGKTMMLRALDCLHTLATAPKAQKSDVLEIYPFQFSLQTRQSPTVFQLVFVQNEIRYDYTVEVANRCILREKMLYYPRGRSSELFTRETDLDKQVTGLHIGSTTSISNKGLAILEGNTLWNNTVLGAFGKSNVDWPEMMEVQRWFTDTLQMLIMPSMNVTDFADKVLEAAPEYKSLMIDFLEKADVQISDIRIKKDEEDLGEGKMTLVPVDEEMRILKEDQKVTFQTQNLKIKRQSLFFTHEVENEKGERHHFELPWNFESKGTLQYYGLASILALMIKTSKINLIDEFESNLHPDLMKHFILTFLANARQSQLLITTHNVHLLNDKDILRYDVVWFTQKRSDGSTEIYSLADFDSGVFRKNGSIINAYKAGKLGAVPHTGSIFIPQQ